MLQKTFLRMWMCPLLLRKCTVEMDSVTPIVLKYSVEIMNDSEPYEMARALDSDDDRPVGELIESDVEMLRRIFPGRRDPRVQRSCSFRSGMCRRM